MSKFDKKFVGIVKSKIGTSLVISMITMFVIVYVVELLKCL